MAAAATRTIGITMGDPTGVGPELIARLLADEAIRRTWQGDTPALLPSPAAHEPAFVLYGDEGVLARAAAALFLPWPPAGLRIEAVTALSRDEATPGRPSSASGAAQVAYLEAALHDAAAGRLAGLCTAPLHKASAMAAGLPFPGHTELLAARLGGEVVMMLCGPSLRVALCTTHIPLSQVSAALTAPGIAGVIRTTALSLQRDFAIPAPRIVVAGLNPHAGEAGHLGREELDIIAPAIARARALPELAAMAGLELLGPEVPDALFRLAVHPAQGVGGPGRRPDAVVAMYHDQGLIPLKLLDFHEGVNVTLGLPIVRTSPDHGTAHDIAGTGRARPDSLAAALRLCRDHVAARARFDEAI